jgi:F0F1-type ATP synthase membrane subunit c/vacuolar-type H+-ATPase subunit K
VPADCAYETEHVLNSTVTCVGETKVCIGVGDGVGIGVGGVGVGIGVGGRVEYT